MKTTISKILLTGVCTIFAGFALNVGFAEDFQFDLDKAVQEASGGEVQNKGQKEPKQNQNQNVNSKAIYPSVDAKSYLESEDAMYYDPALTQSLIAKYKEGNYTGCIQEAQSKMKKESPDAVAMYYMALSYTKIGDVNTALEIYEEILKLKPSSTLRECAIRGRDCLIGGPACPATGVEGADMDEKIQEYKQDSGQYKNETPAGVPSPLSSILSKEELATLPDTMYPASSEYDDAKKKVVDNYIAKQNQEIQQVLDNAPDGQDVANAIKTLQNAGIAITIQPQATGMMNANYNNDIAQMTALLGSNSQQNRSFDMMPYMLMQAQNNPQQYNPQMFQAMMMNYMMPSMDLTSNNKD